MKKIYAIAALAAAIATPSFAQNVYIGEAPTNIRFEQYTGATGEIFFWRLPSPGASKFPGTSCTYVKIPNDRVEHASPVYGSVFICKKQQQKRFLLYQSQQLQYRQLRH